MCLVTKLNEHDRIIHDAHIFLSHIASQLSSTIYWCATATDANGNFNSAQWHECSNTCQKAFWANKQLHMLWKYFMWTASCLSFKILKTLPILWCTTIYKYICTIHCALLNCLNKHVLWPEQQIRCKTIYLHYNAW